MKKIYIFLILFIIVIVFVILYIVSNKNVEYYNSTKLQEYISNTNTETNITINGKKYSNMDINLREYFYENRKEKNQEIIDTIIFSDEARKRNILVEEERTREIEDRINNYKFSDNFLNSIKLRRKSIKRKND